MAQAPQNSKVEHSLNYVTANRFYIEMESEIKASFSECQGLGVKLKREAYFEGGVNDQQRITVGQAEFSDVTLKRGLTDDVAFLDWVGKILDQLFDSSVKRPNTSKHTRRNINIMIFNQAGETMQCWTLIGAIPVAWKAPSLQANATSVAIEELTLAYEGLKVFGTGGGKGVTFHTQPQGYGALGRDQTGSFSSH